MAGLGLQSERHIGVVLGHHLVQEALGLDGQALSPLVAGVAAALVGFFAVPPQTQLAHNPAEGLPHVVLHSGRRLNELAVEHGGAGQALWGRSSELDLQP